MIDFSLFEKKINICFKNKKLLEQAFIHRSYINENGGTKLEHNERLEFLGDAVLELIVTDFLFNKYKDKGFYIFGVSLDKNKDSWIGAIKKDKLSWTHVSDLGYWDAKPAKNYNVSSIPFTVLIDKDGKILAKGLHSDELEQKLELLFNNSH